MSSIIFFFFNNSKNITAPKIIKNISNETKNPLPRDIIMASVFIFQKTTDKTRKDKKVKRADLNKLLFKTKIKNKKIKKGVKERIKNKLFI